MDNYAKGYGCLQGHLECLVNTLEIKIAHDYLGTVTIPKEVTGELKAQISHMLKRSEEVGNEPSEFMNMPKKAPHGAGSYHDPEHHNKLMDAVEDSYDNKREEGEDKDHVKPGCFNG